MPIYRYRNSSAKPVKPAYEGIPITIGDHLRKRRLEAGLTQEAAATMMGITSESVSKWELDAHGIRITAYPKLLSFIGYYPFHADTLPEKILKYRRITGSPNNLLGLLLGMDGSTLCRVSLGKYKLAPSRYDRFMRLYEMATIKPLE